uniref:ZAD domain-containing protein n=1 Tax=Anopheles atroparvus TaxID=41427 RepID=A0AAG5DXB4_ANOAO
MEDSRTKATNQCRLCLETLNTTTHIGIDLSSASEVRALVKEMYTIEVFATDQVKSICVPCYKSMITHYKNLSCRRNKKRIVQMNFAIQLKLKSVDAYQENDAVLPRPGEDTNIRNDGARERLPSATNKQTSVLAKETSNSDRVASPTLPPEQNNNTQKNSVTKSTARKGVMGTESVTSDKNRSPMPSVGAEERKKTNKSCVERNQSLSHPSKPSASGHQPTVSSAQNSDRRNVSSSDKNSGQRAQEKVSEKAPEKYSEKAPEKSSEKAPEKASEKAPEKSSEKTSGKEQEKVTGSSSLIPIISLMDCLATPEYLDALFPLKVSLSLDDVKPLEYLCDNCFLTFKTEDEFFIHRRQKCVGSCRYCYAQLKSHHVCAFSSKYSVLNTSIKGSVKYRAKYVKNTGAHKETDISKNPKGTSTKPKAFEGGQNSTDYAVTKKSGLDRSRKKVSGKTRLNSSSSTSSRSASRPAQAGLSSDSSSESSAERSIFIESESDEEMKTLVDDIRRKVKKKMKQANRILD